MPTFVTRFDMRGPGLDPRQRQELYRRAVTQAAYVDAHGQDALMVSEHHGAEDGYLPSPLTLASAMAAVTSRIPITVSALLANLYDPLRLAEDIAVLDLVSGGRVSYTIGLGYRPEEYAMFGRPWKTRGRDIEATIRTLLQAWTGEPFEHDGRTVQVTPTPASRPHPMLFYGGGSVAAAKRAGRLGLGFQPQHADPEILAAYDEACRAEGREPGFVMTAPPGPINMFCTEDVEGFWDRYGHHLLADAAGYQRWQGESNHYVADTSTTVEEMRAAGVYAVMTPDEIVDRSRAGELHLVAAHPACGGLPADPSWASLRLICETVMPALRPRRAGAS